MPLTLSTSAALALAVTLAGCESYYYSRAAREDTRAAYLRFLAHYAEGSRAPEARRRVDRLSYREARRVDRPLGYHQYLQRHPDGAFARAARSRLAQLSLKRAQTAASLELLLERYPGTPQARAARARLPSLLAQEALATDSPVPAARFVDRFPTSREAPRIRAHLAAIRFKSLRVRVPDLEAFIEAFAGTRHARLAEARLEQLLARVVRDSLDEEELARFRARFPRSSRLAAIERLVSAARCDRAIAALDVDKLASFSDDDARSLVRLCRRSARRCNSLREHARQAAPWRPTVGLAKLRARAFAADPQSAWEAMAQLAWMVDFPAGDLLLELVGSERLSTVWAASRALSDWAARQGPRLRQWIESRLAKLRTEGSGKRATNPDEDQRRAYLELMECARAGSGGEAKEGSAIRAGRSRGHQPDCAAKSGRGRSTLRRLGGPRALTSGYLSLLWERRRSPAAPLPLADLTRFTGAARARVRWLRDAFPAELHKESAFAAMLAERELFALRQAIARVLRGAKGAGLAGLEDVRREARTLLDGWQAALERNAKGGAKERYRRARWPDVDREVRRHEQGRGRALARLQKSGAAGRIMAAALCRMAPRPACGPGPTGL
jgi:hypothetical protein